MFLKESRFSALAVISGCDHAFSTGRKQRLFTIDFISMNVNHEEGRRPAKLEVPFCNGCNPKKLENETAFFSFEVEPTKK
jgi:hypothetical protein